MFDESLNEVLKLMRLCTFPRFANSRIAKDLLQKYPWLLLYKYIISIKYFLMRRFGNTGTYYFVNRLFQLFWYLIFVNNWKLIDWFIICDLKEKAFDICFKLTLLSIICVT